MRPTGQYWSGAIVGVGFGLLLGAAFVERLSLTPNNTTWASVVGIVLIRVGNVVSQFIRRRKSPETTIRE